jgi:hypothetical protein
VLRVSLFQFRAVVTEKLRGHRSRLQPPFCPRLLQGTEGLPVSCRAHRALRKERPTPGFQGVLFRVFVIGSPLTPNTQIVMDLMNLDVSSSESFGESVEERVIEISGVSDEDDGDASPTRGSPPSVASSNEWDKLTDSGTQTPAS